MSDRRTFRWKSGRLPATSLLQFLQVPVTLDAADPQIPNLPLISPSGGTIASGAAASEAGTTVELVGAAVSGGTIAAGAALSEGATDVAMTGASIAAGAALVQNESTHSLAGAAIASAAVLGEGATANTMVGASTAGAAVLSQGQTDVALVGAAIGGQTVDLGGWKREADRQRRLEAEEDEELIAIVKAMAPAVWKAMNPRRFQGARR